MLTEVPGKIARPWLGQHFFGVFSLRGLDIQAVFVLERCPVVYVPVLMQKFSLSQYLR